MTDFDPASSRSSPKLPSSTSLQQSVNSGFTIRQICDDNDLSINNHPVSLKPLSPGSFERRSRSEENLPAHPPIHRRSRTEAHSVPRIADYTYLNHEHTPQSYKGFQPDLQDVDLHTTEGSSRPKFDRTRNLFSGIFQGESAPVRFGLVRPSHTEAPESGRSKLSNDFAQMAQSLTSLPTNKLQKKMSVSSPLKQVTSTNRFSFFGSKTQEQKVSGLPEPADDQFLNLDVEAELFPNGSSELPTAEAMKTLQDNAERLIRDLQAAYKLRTFALHEALAERATQEEEVEETKSRFSNLKSQLDGMADKVSEQDKTMKTLMEDLKAERQLRQEEEDARRLSVVSENGPEQATEGERERRYTKRHSKRSSGVTMNSDSGFESGDDSIAESIFSRRNDGVSSPTTIRTSRAPSPAPETSTQASIPSIPEVQSSSSKPQTVAPHSSKPSAYDRVIKGISATGIGGAIMNSSRFSSSKCPNCYGAPASDAWSVVGILREENRALKIRIGELESAVEECITLVGG